MFNIKGLFTQQGKLELIGYIEKHKEVFKVELRTDPGVRAILHCVFDSSLF